jgi:hypothetical protein
MKFECIAQQRCTSVRDRRDEGLAGSIFGRSSSPARFECGTFGKKPPPWVGAFFAIFPAIKLEKICLKAI